MQEIKQRVIRAIIAFIIFLIIFILEKTILINEYVVLSFCILAYLISGYDILLKALKNIFHGQVFDENFLMIIATVGAFVVKSYEEAVMVMVLYQIGEAFQDYAVNKSRNSISTLVNLVPNEANLLKDGTLVVVEPEILNIDDVILVKVGEKVPVDGVIIEGESDLDVSALTGESKLRSVYLNDEVLAGSINKTGVLKLRVTKTFSNSAVSKILELVEEATAKKSKSENFIQKFAKIYTPIVVILALILGVIVPTIIYFVNGNNLFNDYIFRACSFLVISCPCALVISVPLSFFGGIGASSKIGVLIKGSIYIEKLAKVNGIAFDKTGTLTKGEFIVKEIVSLNDSKENIIKYASYAEYYSNHPLALAIKKYSQESLDLSQIKEIKELAGYGIYLNLNEDIYLVGNHKLLEKYNLKCEYDDIANTHIYVASLTKVLGYIIFEDEVKEEAYNLINELNNLNINNTYMLTGDNLKTALSVKDKLNLKEVKANLLPENKVEALNELKKENQILAYVGDGINDAPVLVASDIGISMGTFGSDVAIEASSVVIMDDDLAKIPLSIKLSRFVMKIVLTNIIFAILVKLVVLVLATFGYANMWLAIFADVGVACLCILNALRTLYFVKKS